MTTGQTLLKLISDALCEAKDAIRRGSPTDATTALYKAEALVSIARNLVQVGGPGDPQASSDEELDWVALKLAARFFGRGGPVRTIELELIEETLPEIQEVRRRIDQWYLSR